MSYTVEYGFEDIFPVARKFITIHSLWSSDDKNPFKNYE